MLILNNDEIQHALTMERCVEALEALFAEMAAGRALGSPRADIFTPTDRPDRYYAFKSMAGVSPTFGMAALRLNSDVLSWPIVNGTRRRVKVPAAPGDRWVGLVMLFSSATGEPLAIFPDGVMQRLRVGATNALGAKYLSRADAETIGLLGSGWQAGAQLMGFRAVRSIRTINVFSPNPDHRRAFADEMTRLLDVDVRPCSSAEEAVRNADILASATNVVQPIVEPRWLEPGTHVSCIKKQEVDEHVFERCDRVVLHTLSQLKEDDYLSPHDRGKVPELGDSGWWTRLHDRTLDGRPVYELAEIVSGHVAGRENDRQITMFMNNLGTGLQFAAAGAVAYAEAKRLGLGREIPTDWFLQSVHP